MKDRSKAKKRLTLNSRDIHAGWIVGAGASVVICLLATFATAYRHDAYSSRLGLGDLMTTDVWFRVFLALTCFSLLLFLGLLVYAFVAGRIDRSGDNEGQESLPIVEEKAPAIEQQDRVAINEAKLRDIFGSDFMHEWMDSDGSKSYLDQLIEDLQHVRDHYKKGAKQDDQHYCINNIIEIAFLLDKPEYLKKPFGTFPKLCRSVFDCMHLPRPKNIKNHPAIAEHVKKRFYYLLKK